MLDALLVSAVILGIIEGVTEFLPVSSTGHLILAAELIGFTGPGSTVFEVVIQLGAILAVCWVYRARLFAALAGLLTDRAAQRFVANVIVAFLPAAVAGVFLHHFIKSVLFSPWVVAVSLVVGGFLILLIERIRPLPRIRIAEGMPLRTAFGIGLCQILAMIPGVSRAGATIMGGLMLGVSRPAATEFSFFLAIPTMFGAAVYDLYKSRGELSFDNGAVIAVGFVVAFFAALVVVRWLVDFVGKHGFGVFAWYRIALGTIALIALWYVGG
jgi:undecaprenyl-diphosphatase